MDHEEGSGPSDGPHETQLSGTSLPSDFALRYARNGYRVFPLFEPQDAGCSCGNGECGNVGKHPRISHWQNAASSDPATVAAWWKLWPRANIGMSLEGLVVLDVDPRHAGFESLDALEKEHTSLGTRSRQVSGSGGLHYL